MKTSSKVGVFGSSFDPPTLGHSFLLAESGWRLGLERIIVVPTGEAWHKDTAGSLPGKVRLALAEAAFGSDDALEVSPVELDREGPSYTCDTLEQIQSANPDSQITLLAGSDAALGIADWHRPERVLELAKFAVAPRSGIARDGIERVFEGLGAGERIEFFDLPRVDVSSTLVRERIATGGPWKHLVPHGVAEMIDNEDLYGRNK